jgi:Lon protease-like protein
MFPPGPLAIPIFPLAGALLFPRAHLPLHIFEPRYRAMVRDALAGERLIGMVQPRDQNEPPALFAMGGLGRIAVADELADGRFNIVLEGIGRYRIARELTVDTLYRQVEAEPEEMLEAPAPLGLADRAELEREARLFADALGYAVDWSEITRLDDEMLVNGIAQIAPFDIGSKQALLEAADVGARCDLLVQFMQFQRMVPGGADGPETRQ